MNFNSIFEKFKKSAAAGAGENGENIVYDFLIIGSGFGGSISAMRLSQKGYKVAVLEAGKRWQAEDFPKSNWNLKKYLWMPLLGWYGIQRMTLLRGVMVLRGAGVGGGSLVYANTLLQPDADVFAAGWPQDTPWAAELAPYYDEARRMLGVTMNPLMLEAEKYLKTLSEKMGAGSTYHATTVGTFFGEAGKTVDDPYFSGAGPRRAGCTACGGCMIGCRHNAKNTLDKNYLYFAEKWGARVLPETTATKILPQQHGGYQVETRVTTSMLRKKGPTLQAKRLIVAAGVLGTLDLLLKNRQIYKTLPRISERLGHNIRTNGESLVATTSFDTHRDLARGIALGAVFHPDKNTKIEAVKYPPGSGVMRLTTVPLTPNGTRLTRPLKLIVQVIRRFPTCVRLYFTDWGKQTIILLVMQKIDQTMQLTMKRSVLLLGRFGLSGEATDKPIPSYLPVAQEAALLLEKEINGAAQNLLSEVVLGTPVTAHILGGCAIASDAAGGVVDRHHEVFNYPGLYVCDGSVISSNLGVNPSLTISALTERFAAAFPVADPALYKERQIVYSRK